MISKKLRLIETIVHKVRIIKKTFIISKETKKRGGNAGRLSQRSSRRAAISSEKISLRDDLVKSWGLGEISPPTEEEKMRFYLYYHNLPWSYLLEVKKKYWHGNI